MRGAANRPGVILKSRHRDYTSTSCQIGSESAHSKMKAAECDNRAAFDGHALTGSIGSDELEDTHSPVLRPKKTSKLADLSGSARSYREPSNFSL